jgi:drug/metabolite transporter (DMT)-like permease
VSRWSVTRLSFMAVLTPLIALALGALVRHERLAPLTLAGGLVVLAGVAIGMRPARATA